MRLRSARRACQRLVTNSWPSNFDAERIRGPSPLTGEAATERTEPAVRRRLPRRRSRSPATAAAPTEQSAARPARPPNHPTTTAFDGCRTPTCLDDAEVATIRSRRLLAASTRPQRGRRGPDEGMRDALTGSGTVSNPPAADSPPARGGSTRPRDDPSGPWPQVGLLYAGPEPCGTGSRAEVLPHCVRVAVRAEQYHRVRVPSTCFDDGSRSADPVPRRAVVAQPRGPAPCRSVSMTSAASASGSGAAGSWSAPGLLRASLRRA